MKLSDSMRRCLTLLDQYGEALRSGPRSDQWSWYINGIAMSYGVDRCIRAGLVRNEGRDRVVLSALGRKVLAQMSCDERPQRERDVRNRAISGRAQR